MRWWEKVVAWDDSHRLVTDALLAAALALASAVLAIDVIGYGSGRVTVVWSVALAAPLTLRRVAPATSAVGVYLVAFTHVVIAGVILVFPADMLVLVALYSVTVHGRKWAYLTAFTTSLLGAGTFALIAVPFGYSLLDAAFIAMVTALLFVTTFALGLVRRSRRIRLGALVDRARRLEIERDQQVQLATAAERARIAREMHDIVAHSLSVIIAQADGGRYAADAEPAAATRALTTISETGRAALADMRRLLGVLRPAEPHTGGTVEPAPSGPVVADLTPQPAVDDLAALVAGVRDSGVRASLVRMGAPRPLPPGTGLTVYRICQEALTNVLKHAGPDAQATVLLQWTTASVVLEVSDDGRGAAADTDGRGQGVLGMRERAAMLGGTLTVGPRPGGGYRVRAEIPIPQGGTT